MINNAIQFDFFRVGYGCVRALELGRTQKYSPRNKL
jgi:hypothetical protein